MRMKHNNAGRAAGLTLVLLLIVALLIAFLVVKSMGTLGIGGSTPQEENYVQQAQDAVDALNERMGQSIEQH